MISHAHIVRTERESLRFRLLALLVVAVGVYFSKAAISLPPVLIIAGGYLAYTLWAVPALVRRLASVYLIYGMIVVDAAILTSVLHFGGGIWSTIFILLPLFIIYHSVYLGYPSGLSSATAFSLCYVAVAFLEGQATFAGPLMIIQIPLFYLLAIFSGYLASRSLQGLREKEELQEFIRVGSQAKGVAEAAKTMGRALELDRILQGYVATRPHLIRLSNYLLARLDEETGRLVGGDTNIDPAQLDLRRIDQLVYSPTAESASALALETGNPIVTHGGDEEASLPNWAQQLGVGTLLAVPLMAQGRKLGVMYFFETGAPHAVSEGEIHLAKSYSELAANAIANVETYRSTQEKIDQLTRELEATLRRLERFREPRRKTEIIVDDLKVDGIKGQAFLNKDPISLSPTEFELLYVLAENAGHPVNQETLLRRVWGEGSSAQTSVVDVSIHRLRKRIERGGFPRRILTIRGAGYMLAEVRREGTR